MIGMTWGDPHLTLPAAQWGALVGNGALWLLGRHAPRRAGLLACALLFGTFWNCSTSRDVSLLFDQAHALHAVPWQHFLSDFASKAYIEHQTPYYTFYISRAPDLWRHQCYLIPWTLLNYGLLWALYGETAALLCATPLLGLLLHQPCHDVLLFGLLLIVMRLCQMRHRSIAALVYGLCWCCKPLVVLTLPLMLPRLGLAGLGSVGGWIVYIKWSCRWPFGRSQLAFLLKQTLITSRGHRKRPARWVSRRVSARWRKIGGHSLRALPVYLFPAWLRPWTWQGIALGLVVLAGYGNVKYFLLDLLFLFPVTEIAS